MPAFDDAARTPLLCLADHLKATDQAYARGAREECIQMVGDLYAFFDKAAAGVASITPQFVFSMVGLVAVSA